MMVETAARRLEIALALADLAVELYESGRPSTGGVGEGQAPLDLAPAYSVETQRRNALAIGPPRTF